MLRNGSSPVHPDTTMKEQDLIIFIFFNFPVASPPEQRSCCPPSIMFGTGMLSGLELSFQFYA